MRYLTFASLAVLPLGTLFAFPFASADDAPKQTRPAVAAKSARVERLNKGASPAEREKTALAFVGEHHPELASLLQQLKSMRPGDYDRAISELFQVSRSLENLRLHNPRRYELGLDLWKAKSKAELLAAKLVSGPTAELESQLRSALENQLDLELRQQQLEKEQLNARLDQIEGTINRLNKNREKLIESRFKALRNKGQRARGLDGGKFAPVKPATAKGESKA